MAESPGGDVRLPINPELDESEHHEHCWASYAEARSLLNDRLAAILQWAREQVS